MTDYICPIDGCDYETDKRASLKAHINAKGDPKHVWADLVNEVDAQSAETVETTEDTDDDSDDDSDDAADIDAEYRAQYETTEPDDDSDDSDDAADAGSGSMVGWALVGASVAVVVAVLARGDNDGSDEPAVDESDALDSIDGWNDL